jgi:hypothetical protein
MPRWIAEEKIRLEFEGRTIASRLLVGRPRMVDKNEAVCVVAIEGVERPYEIHGDGTLQALLLGIRFLGFRLHDLTSRGARVLGPRGRADVSLEAMFGPLLVSPRSARPRSTGGRGRTRRSRRSR